MSQNLFFRHGVKKPQSTHAKWITGYSAFSQRSIDETIVIRLLPRS